MEARGLSNPSDQAKLVAKLAKWQPSLHDHECGGGVRGDVRPVTRVRVRVAHEIPERSPLQLTVGDEVQVGDRDSEWPEFVFVTAAGGSGWVPARHLSQAAGPAVVQTAYDTTELPTRDGQMLEVLVEDRRSGWLWCRAGTGDEGWVPVRTVEGGACG